MLTANDAMGALPGPRDVRIRPTVAIARLEDNEVPLEDAIVKPLESTLLNGAGECFKGMGNSTIKPTVENTMLK